MKLKINIDDKIVNPIINKIIEEKIVKRDKAIQILELNLSIDIQNKLFKRGL